MTEETKALAEVTEAQKALAKAETLEETVEMRAKAQAFVAYFKKAKDAQDKAQVAKEFQLRAERKAGEFLLEMEKNPGGWNESESRGRVARPQDSPPKLEDLGISKYDSSCWQRLARLPEDEFERMLMEAKTAGELTQSRLLKEAKAWIKDHDHEEAQKIVKSTLKQEHQFADLSNISTPEAAEKFAEHYNEHDNKKLIIKVAQTAGVDPKRFDRAVDYFEEYEEAKVKAKPHPVYGITPKMPEDVSNTFNQLTDARYAAKMFRLKVEKDELDYWHKPEVQRFIREHWPREITTIIMELRQLRGMLKDE